MKYLIVSADDFGLTNVINEGIVKAFLNGIVTNINIMPTGGEFENALKLLKKNGITEIGAHLSLTQTIPLAEKNKVLTLLTSAGNFHNSYKGFFSKLILGKIDINQAYFELKKQMEILNATGLRITNLSSHENIHMAPCILNLFIRLAKEFKVKAIRFPHGDKSFYCDLNMVYKKIVLFFFERGMRKKLNASGIVFPDNLYGFIDSGKINENIVLQIIKSLEEGTTELVCHPGIFNLEWIKKFNFYKNCEEEFKALTGSRVKRLIVDKKVSLINYNDFLQRSGK